MYTYIHTYDIYIYIHIYIHIIYKYLEREREREREREEMQSAAPYLAYAARRRAARRYRREGRLALTAKLQVYY